jgi:cytoskeletal protein CcmA (bactofilin family)
MTNHWRPCGYGTFKGKECRLKYHGLDEGDADFCAFHTKTVRTNPTSVDTERTQRLLDRLASGPADTQIVIVEGVFPNGVQLPERISAPFNLVRGSVRGDLFGKVREAQSIAIETTSFDSALRLSNAVISGAVSLGPIGGPKIEVHSCTVKGEFCLALPGHCIVQLIGCTFEKNLSSTMEPAEVSFEGHGTRRCVVLGTLSISGAGVRSFLAKDTDFGSISASGATFSGGAHLQDVNVSGVCNMDGTKIYGPLKLEGRVVVKSHLKMNGAEIRGALHANDLIVSGDFHLSASQDDRAQILGDDVSLGKATFKGEASFKGRTFNKLADFSRCTFHHAPDFEGCTLTRDTRFPMERRFFGARWFLEQNSLVAVARYGVLKTIFKDLNARDLEGMFDALEARSQRKSRSNELNWFERFVSRLYDFFTSYGQSYLRPLGWLSAALLGFGLWFAARVTGVRWTPPDLQAIGDGLALSFQNVVNPFGVWRAQELVILRNSPDPTCSGQMDEAAMGLEKAACLQPWQILSALESLLAVALLALFLLALRWRFKRG